MQMIFFAHPLTSFNREKESLFFWRKIDVFSRDSVFVPSAARSAHVALKDIGPVFDHLVREKKRTRSQQRPPRVTHRLQYVQMCHSADREKNVIPQFPLMRLFINVLDFKLTKIEHTKNSYVIKLLFDL